MKRAEIWEAYLFLIPGVAWLSFVYLYPIINVIQISLTSGDNKLLKFVGLFNYQLMLKDSLFGQSVLHNLMLFISVPIMVILALIFSTFLYENIPGWRAYQVIIFIPVILAIAAVGIIFGQILQSKGLLNEFLRAIQLDFLAQDWLGNSKYALWSLAAVIIWKEVGFGTILFLARLMSVPVELYEAAKLDGASWWQSLRHITIPQLSTVIEFYTVLQIIVVFCWVFDYVYVMTSGGPVNSTIVGEYFIYKYAFQFDRLDVASAVAVMYLIASVILMVIRNRVSQQMEV